MENLINKEQQEKVLERFRDVPIVIFEEYNDTPISDEKWNMAKQTWVGEGKVKKQITKQ